MKHPVARTYTDVYFIVYKVWNYNGFPVSQCMWYFVKTTMFNYCLKITALGFINCHYNPLKINEIIKFSVKRFFVQDITKEMESPNYFKDPNKNSWYLLLHNSLPFQNDKTCYFHVCYNFMHYYNFSCYK